MREIKFRAWDERRNVMVEQLEGCSAPCREIISNKSRTMQHLMQFTGLKDKNGVEIYEGDILKRPLYKFTVTLDVNEETNFNVWRYVHSISNKELEVIGNICENEELLE